jgi:hypothetical protein
MSGIAAAPSLDPLIAEAKRRARRRRAGVTAMVLAAAATAWALTRGGGERPAPVVLPRLELKTAGMGFACAGAPNSPTCDRVAIAVYLQHPASKVTATVGGRTAALHHYARCDWRGYRRFCATSFTGYLEPAGLADHPRWATVTFRAKGYAPVRRRVEVSAGWG